MIAQSRSQIDKTYGRDDAQTIITGGVGSQLFLSGQDLTASLELERLLGRTGVEIEDESGRHRVMTTNLMNADQIRAMKNDEALFLHRGNRPALIKLEPYFKNRRLRKRSQIPPPPLPATDDEPVKYVTL